MFCGHFYDHHMNHIGFTKKKKKQHYKNTKSEIFLSTPALVTGALQLETLIKRSCVTLWIFTHS